MQNIVKTPKIVASENQWQSDQRLCYQFFNGNTPQIANGNISIFQLAYIAGNAEMSLNYLNKIENWAISNGFKFSESKRQCVHFCQLRKQHDDPVLLLYGSPIPVVEESKFLGMIFDRKLSFIPNIKYRKAKCLKALNLLKVVSHTSWNADQTTLLKLYGSLVRSKLDYGCIIYGSARKSYL